MTPRLFDEDLFFKLLIKWYETSDDIVRRDVVEPELNDFIDASIRKRVRETLERVRPIYEQGKHPCEGEDCFLCSMESGREMATKEVNSKINAELKAMEG